MPGLVTGSAQVLVRAEAWIDGHAFGDTWSVLGRVRVPYTGLDPARAACKRLGPRPVVLLAMRATAFIRALAMRAGLSPPISAISPMLANKATTPTS